MNIRRELDGISAIPPRGLIQYQTNHITIISNVPSVYLHDPLSPLLAPSSCGYSLPCRACRKSLNPSVLRLIDIALLRGLGLGNGRSGVAHESVNPGRPGHTPMMTWIYASSNDRFDAASEVPKYWVLGYEKEQWERQSVNGWLAGENTDIGAEGDEPPVLFYGQGVFSGEEQNWELSDFFPITRSSVHAP